MATGRRTEVGRTGEAVNGIDVSVEQALRNVGWMITIQNLRAESLRIVWDESSYVNTGGFSTGRIIMGMTRRLHDDQVQPPSPIPAGSKFQEFIVPQAQVSMLDGNVVLPSAGGEGQLRIVFETEKGRETWVGRVTFPVPQKVSPSFWGTPLGIVVIVLIAVLALVGYGMSQQDKKESHSSVEVRHDVWADSRDDAPRVHNVLPRHIPS
jgi:hypothetical protein